jgi:hypothetical protein
VLPKRADTAQNRAILHRQELSRLFLNAKPSATSEPQRAPSLIPRTAFASAAVLRWSVEGFHTRVPWPSAPPSR